MCTEGTSILNVLKDYLLEKKLTITQFAEGSGLNPITLSNLVHGHRPISIHHLDIITMGMQKKAGIFYDQYINDYILNMRPNWRRVRPLLHRCAELEKLDCMKRIVSFLTENLMYLPMLFETAETFLALGFKDAAVLLYECVAEGERLQHSERLALCQYRLFTLGLGDDQDINLQVAHRFEPFVDRLDDADQLDALKRLADVYASLHRWEKVVNLADKMEEKAKMHPKYSLDKQPERPLIYYILYSYLLKAAVYDERSDYRQALYYTSLYSNIGESSYSEYTEDEQRVVSQFQEWSTANIYVYRLMSGEVEVLREYVDYVELRPDEIPTALYKIVQAANLYQIDIDDVLLRFQGKLDYYDQRSRLGKLNQQITKDRHACFQIELATYYLRTNRWQFGLDYILRSLQFSVKIGSEHNILRCIGLFEQYRYVASTIQQKEYKRLIREVQKCEKKADHLADRR
ncbi:helix-turn-helix domain-containing protein [Paenibacillus durus]|uniref:HTH cro/C1-type domain-containing protein n=1 Tax=Paenibacillus durus TaxID=44251 RepID=A0A089HU03_PAEDU|nr:helix-turn-helix domain-containing protein [Paenibacillus durus]AIQ13833.1 hypothetical protein PDUR_19370 [Paenibacillus durus]